MEYELKPLQPGNFRCDHGLLVLKGADTIRFLTGGLLSDGTMIALWRATLFPEAYGDSIYGKVTVNPADVAFITINGIDGPVPVEFRALLNEYGIELEVTNQRPALQPLPPKPESERARRQRLKDTPAEVIVKEKRR